MHTHNTYTHANTTIHKNVGGRAGGRMGNRAAITSTCVHEADWRENKHGTDKRLVTETKIVYQKSVGEVADADLRSSFKSNK